MPFGPSNVLIVYNTADIASEELAMSYSSSKGVPSSNILSVTTDTDASFDNMTEYVTDLETPVIAKINALSSSDIVISAIVLSFRIPVQILVSGSEARATCSRLASCMMPVRTDGTENRLFLSFDSEEVISSGNHILCVTHLDAPTLAVARSRMNSFTQASSSLKIDGYIYIDSNDRYANTTTSRRWIDSLKIAAFNSPFNTIEAPASISGTSTVFSRIIDGSVVFSSGVSFAGTGYFNRSSKSKAFYFNADVDGFSSPRNTSSQKPAMKALEENYAIVAGMVSDPSSMDNEYQYPDPRSIIHCVQNDIPLGCGIIWSQRVIGQHLAVYGDPLAKFIKEATKESKFGAIDGFFSAVSHMAQARANARTRELYASMILRVISASPDLYFKQKFINEAKAIAFAEDGMSLGLISDSVNELRNMSRHAGYAYDDTITMPSFEKFIVIAGRKIPLSFLKATTDSQLILNRIGSSMLQPKGIATVEFRLPVISGNPRLFHMQAIGSDDEGNNVFTVDSINRPDLWRYEAEPGIMRSIPSEGMYTALAGRYIEFTHPEGFSPPFVRISGTFSILVTGDSPVIVHQAEWRTQE